MGNTNILVLDIRPNPKRNSVVIKVFGKIIVCVWSASCGSAKIVLKQNIGV